ncbi:WhiB family transcriptional regulator [Streptomyces showdoensis]|uniref:WhiB family transcriptional regulator n=1 Tax=Streptomyces showdoensis TaxID=68268 RepID=UPI001F0B46D4|nr:WhiB family transcriptional regulator [Streptomyces showdoensis]
MHQSDSSPWQASAACADLSPSVVFSRRGKEAAPALRACAVCPVRRECETAVAPAESWFDGVCAGRLWRNGRPVKPRRRRGEPAPAPRTAATALAGHADHAALDAAGAALAGGDRG